ncbi:MAG: hypothetical protein M9962_05045 [Oligoflexia bacterium]|nr:hypothetical protein [Oligoflexia bacterium]
MKKILIAFYFLFFTLPAFAYIPPSYFIYNKIAGEKETPFPTIKLSVTKPAAGGTEETLGTITISSIVIEENRWPVLSILFPSTQAQLKNSIKAFGLNIPTEKDLLIVPENQISQAKDLPKKLYKNDENIKLKRYGKSYAWVHRNAENKKEIWIEKDSFLPLRVQGDCPKELEDVLAKIDLSEPCSFEFRNQYSLKRGRYQQAKIILIQKDVPLLYFNFDKITTNKSPANIESTERVQSTLQPALNAALDKILN